MSLQRLSLIALFLLSPAARPSGAADTANPPDGWQDARSRVVLVGDSTVTDAAGWGASFAACLRDDVLCVNLAQGGRSSSSFRDEGHWDDALALQPDWVLIQFGHNDEPGHPGRENSPGEGYRDNLIEYIEEARAAGVRPVLVTPLCRRQWSRDPQRVGRIESSLAAYARAVHAVAAETSTPVVDLHMRSLEAYESLTPSGCRAISPTKKNGQLDGTHLNPAGSALFGAVVAMDCRSYVTGLADFFPTSKLAGLQNAHRPPPQVAPLPVAAREAPNATTPHGARSFTVAADGTGDFNRIQKAIGAAPTNKSARTTIRIRPGVYVGQTLIPANKPNITLEGAGAAQSVITYALTVHDPHPPSVPTKFKGHGVVVLADGFEARGLTFRQMAGDHGQAIALRIDGDRARVEDCHLLGWQDTLRLEGDGHRFARCEIEGRVDYIYGGASAVFDDCVLRTKNSGYVTAASTPRHKPYGFVFCNCQLTGTGRATTYLGRPWRPHSSVAFINCEMDESIKPEGWHNWRNPSNEQTARYAEFNSTGPGAAPHQRVGWSRQLNNVEAQQLAAQVDDLIDHPHATSTITEEPGA